MSNLQNDRASSRTLGQKIHDLDREIRLATRKLTQLEEKIEKNRIGLGEKIKIARREKLKLEYRIIEQKIQIVSDMINKCVALKDLPLGTSINDIFSGSDEIYRILRLRFRTEFGRDPRLREFLEDPGAYRDRVFGNNFSEDQDFDSED
jgi:hypothetical protein